MEETSEAYELTSETSYYKNIKVKQKGIYIISAKVRVEVFRKYSITVVWSTIHNSVCLG